MLLPKRDDIRSFVYDWNVKYPIDRWWREKHKVAFGSPIHRVSSFIDMYIEWTEDEIYSRLYGERIEAEKKKEEGEESTEYVAGKGNWLNRRELSAKEVDSMFDDLDLSKYDDI